MPKEIKKYQCNYCKKSWMMRSRAEKHEYNCFRNPGVKSCITCNNFTTNEDREPWCDKFEKVVMVRGEAIYHCPKHESIYDVEDMDYEP